MMGRPPFISLLFAKQGGKCWICSGPMTLEKEKPNTAIVEHLIPKSRRKEFPKLRKRDNLRAACALCNHRKGSRTLAEFIAAEASK